MARYLVLIFVFFFFKAFAFDIDNLRYNEKLAFEDIFATLKADEDFEKHKSALPKKILKKIFADPKKKIGKDFKIDKYFEDRVLFWGQIYTQFSSKQVLIHDSKNVSIVYDALNFEELYNSKKLNRYQVARERSRIIANSVKDLKKSLLFLSKNSRYKSKKARKLENHLKSIGLKIPRKGKKRRLLFRKLSKNVRVQTGQSDKIFQGIINSYPYLDFLYKKFDYFELPKELLAISFVESSFNLKATSKVGASGVWQIMPFISKALLPRGKNKRPRRNVLMASLGAFHLLAQNFKILKRWDLAVTAYNSGTKHLLRARRKFKKKNISLAYILRNYKTRHLGFASTNFYAEFLALVYILQYKEKVFPLDGVKLDTASSNPQLRYKDIKVYVSKCGLKPQRLFSALKRTSPHLADINNHFRRPRSFYSRGALVFSDIHLSSKRYYKLSNKQLRRSYPKNYKKLIKNKKCKKN